MPTTTNEPRKWVQLGTFEWIYGRFEIPSVYRWCIDINIIPFCLIKMSNVPEDRKRCTQCALLYVQHLNDAIHLVEYILFALQNVTIFILIPGFNLCSTRRMAYGSLHRIFSNFIWLCHFDRCHGIRKPHLFQLSMQNKIIRYLWEMFIAPSWMSSSRRKKSLLHQIHFSILFSSLITSR